MPTNPRMGAEEAKAETVIIQINAALSMLRLGCAKCGDGKVADTPPCSECIANAPYVVDCMEPAIRAAERAAAEEMRDQCAAKLRAEARVYLREVRGHYADDALHHTADLVDALPLPGDESESEAPDAD